MELDILHVIYPACDKGGEIKVNSYTRIFPSNYKQTLPRDATHIVWYNR